MSDLLVVLNPRRIRECLASIRKLKIDKLWLRNMRLDVIEKRWGEVQEAAQGYERIVMLADDAVVRQHALDAVLSLMARHPVVTGYSNLDVNDMRVNLTKGPLPDPSVAEDYDLRTFAELMVYPRLAVPTSFCGHALTAMPHELWQRAPFTASGSPDYNLSKWLAGQGIPIVAAREGFVWHVKERWNYTDQAPRKRLLIGREPAAIELERL